MAKRIKKSNPAMPVWLTLLGLIGLSVLVAVLLRGKDVILLNPKGMIAEEQLKLGLIATLLMLEIAIPSLILFYYIAWKYRETNEKATRDPHTVQGKLFNISIWAFPTITAILLAIVLVPATHRLEPQKTIYDAKDPLTIQVVALRWKWLFIYPEQNIATVNYVQIPEHTPIQFEITADETPMSTFWIPHIGGQLYAMTEHVNRLNLIADTPGDYEGIPGEINGRGFAGMRFKTQVSLKEKFDTWVQEIRELPKVLNSSEYASLLEPSENHTAAFYSNPESEIYSKILGKYSSAHTHNSEASEHGGQE